MTAGSVTTRVDLRGLCSFLAALCSLAMLGCDEFPNQAKQSRPAPIVLYSGARFELVGGSAFGIALDTKTGELCHTFNEDVDTFIPSTGTFHITGTAGHPSLDSIPLCIDLSQNETATVKQILDVNQKARSSREEIKKDQEDLNRMQNQINEK